MFNKNDLLQKNTKTVLNISSEEVLRIQPKVQSKFYKNQHILFYQGHKPYGVYIVFEGSIKKVKNFNQTRFKKIQYYTAPLVLGANLKESQQVYDCTVIAAKESIIAFIAKEQLDQLFCDRSM